MKYIDADKLIAKIEKRKNESRELAQEHKNSSLGNAAQTMANEDEEILSLIDSLQQEQPEVDLEKEINAFFDKWDKNSYGCIFDENGARVTIETIKGVVKHFLNARKEETK